MIILSKIGENIDLAASYIQQGELVVFPTETVYGLGANALDDRAVKRIFDAKNRPADNPLIVHVSSVEMVENVAKNISDMEKKIMNKFWPGPISIILPKKDEVPTSVTAGLDTVSVRMPNNNIAYELIKKAGVPIAAPSANVSGKPSGTCIEDIYDELNNNVAYFLDGGECEIGIESTVVKVEGEDTIRILRPGKITLEDLKEITDNVIIDKNCMQKPEEKEKVLSPGMKHRHYAPKAKCILINFDDVKKLNKKIKEIYSENNEKKIAIMVMEDVFKNIDKDIQVYNLGKDFDEVSQNIFKYLREIDRKNIDVCYIQSLTLKGMGLSLMNRIIRACEYNVIEL